MRVQKKVVVATATLVVTVSGWAVTAAASDRPAVVHPALQAASVGAPVGAGLAAGTGLGAVSTGVAPVAQQSPEVGTAVLSTLAQGTAAVADGGTQFGQAASSADTASAPLAPIVNPVAQPALAAVADQLEAQAPGLGTTGFGADVAAMAAIVRWAAG
jgi:hypothetical protein